MDIKIANSYLIINALAYLITFIIYMRKKNVISTGKIIILIYTISALGAIVLFNHPLNKGVYNDITLFPFIYLYGLIMLTLYPLLNIDKAKILSIRQPSTSALNMFIIIIMVLSLPSLYTVLTNFREVFSELIFGVRFFGFDSNNVAIDRGRGGIHVFSILEGLARFIAPFILMYYLTLKKKNTFFLIGLIVSSVLSNFASASTGARGEIVFNSIIILLLYSFFSRFMDIKTKRAIVIVFSFLAIMFFVVFYFLTIWKFSTRGDYFRDFSYYNYFSQCFLEFSNYGLNAGGVRYGSRTAALIAFIIYPSTPTTYAQRMHAFPNLKLDESHFSTFIGDFTLDYGPYLTVVIFVLFYFFIRKHMQFHGKVPFFKLIPIYFFIKLFAGGWTLFTYSNFGGNLLVITLIMVYFYFRNDYLRQRGLK